MTMPTYDIFIDGKAHKVNVTKASEKAFNVTIDGKPVSVKLQIDKLDLETPFPLLISDKSFTISLPRVDMEKPFKMKVDEVGFSAEVRIPTTRTVTTAFSSSSVAPVSKKSVLRRSTVEGAVTAPMTGKIISLKVKKGDAVKQGQVVCIVEAMKMENEIVAPRVGTVQEIAVSEGSSVSEGETILLIG